MGARRFPWLVACLMLVGLLASCQPAQTAARATPSSQSACPKPPETKIHFDNGATAIYLGRGPFYFGKEIAVGDWIKNPWAVDRKFTKELVVRGHRIDNGDVVNFGYWPTDFGTPAQIPGLAVSFTRKDTEGRTVIFQPEIRVAPEPGGAHLREGAQFWSFPSAGCYVIEATGTGVNQSTKVAVR
jgi:hypothetical protein